MEGEEEKLAMAPPFPSELFVLELLEKVQRVRVGEEEALRMAPPPNTEELSEKEQPMRVGEEEAALRMAPP